MIISASVMCADLTRLGEDIAALEAAGVDWLHFDIMDAHFVPNLTFGPDLIRNLRPVTRLPFDVHLMIEEPIRYLDRYREAGADWIVVHAEACGHLQRTLAAIRDLGARPGVALNPSTPLSALDYVLDDADLVLLMTVNPGYAGQRLVEATLPKIGQLADRLAEEGRNTILQVDGNVSFENARRMALQGARCFVAGSSSVFAEGLTRAEGTRRLREALEGESRS
ncbi:MAG: ribulose-phosphate 3-epimerase [Armatimonadetes bacterium]|nr:ribulose-phosphate 3-epimerase [Armatimonadota bacterium]